jgi:hypothetical protein
MSYLVVQRSDDKIGGICSRHGDNEKYFSPDKTAPIGRYRLSLSDNTKMFITKGNVRM